VSNIAIAKELLVSGEELCYMELRVALGSYIIGHSIVLLAHNISLLWKGRVYFCSRKSHD